MSIFPKLSDGEKELNYKKNSWMYIPKEHIGKIVNNLDDLKELIPEERDWGEIFLNDRLRDGFDIYSRSCLKPDGVPFRDFNVAYSCPGCEKIIIGFPKSELENSINQILTGREGFDLYCDNCNHHLYEFTIKIS